MTDFNDSIERLAELGPLSKLIYHDNEKDLAIATADGSNALGYFVPRHGYANEQIAQAIDSYNEALPLLREMAQALSEAKAENERLRARQAKLKETLLPVCEYGAEIYNRGIPAIPMPDDTIQRLNWAFKMFGG